MEPISLPEGLPLEAFGERVAALIAARHPEARVEHLDAKAIEVAFPNGNRQRVILDNLWKVYLRDAGEVGPALDRHLSLVEPEPETDHDMDAVVALVRNVQSLAWIVSQAPGDVKNAPVAFPLVGDVIEVLAFDLPDRIQIMMAHDLERLEVAPDAMRDWAEANMERRMTRVMRHGEGPVYMLTAGGDYEASLLLDLAMWEVLAQDMAGEVLATVPTRDVLYYTGSEEPDGPDELERMTAKLFKEGDHPVSAQVLRFAGVEVGWTAWTGSGA